MAPKSNNPKARETKGQETESKSAQSHYEAIIAECERMNIKGFPYELGANHITPAGSSGKYDCSSAVSRVLQVAGYGNPTMDSGELASWGDPGPGKVTIWANSIHVFLMFADKCWAWSCPDCKNGWQPLDNYGNPKHPSIEGVPFIARHPPDLGGPAGTIGGNQSGEGTTNYDNASTISKSGALSTFINLPGTLEQAESLALKGEKSLMNDKPLLPFIEQLSTASLRNFTSMPNGNFYAFIPDYFGGLTKRQAYWEIDDIEIISGLIELSDEALATHVYVVGDTAEIDGQIGLIEKIQTTGVVTVFNAFGADFLTGINAPELEDGKKASKSQQEEYQKKLAAVPSLADKNKATSFLKRYGARPYYEEAPMVRSHYFEMFLAYQMFCLLWSQQFIANFEFTFMPELFPGGLVSFPEHGIQCYIDEVHHEGNYTSGFITRAKLSAPSALPKEGRKNVQAGMIRAGIFAPGTGG